MVRYNREHMTGWRYSVIKAIAIILILIVCSVAAQLSLCVVDSQVQQCVRFDPGSIVLGLLFLPGLLYYPLLLLAHQWPEAAYVTTIIFVSTLVPLGWWAVRTLWFPRKR